MREESIDTFGEGHTAKKDCMPLEHCAIDPTSHPAPDSGQDGELCVHRLNCVHEESISTFGEGHAMKKGRTTLEDHAVVHAKTIQSSQRQQKRECMSVLYQNLI